MALENLKETENLVSLHEIKSKSQKVSKEKGFKLHLAMDKSSYAKLVHLKAALKSASYGEVVRRAYQALEFFEPDDAIGASSSVERTPEKLDTADVEHLYIQIPAWLKEAFDSEKSEKGWTYAETVRQSLRVLTQIVREREKLAIKLQEGGDQNADGTNSGEPSHSDVSVANAIFLATA